jgi:hypothetical protein
MNEKQHTPYKIKRTLLVFLIAFFVIGCQSADNSNVEAESTIAVAPPDTATPTTPPTIEDSGYPGPSAPDNAYPGQVQPMPEGALSELPDPERSIPSPGSDTGSIGGFLIRIEGDGFIPVTPRNLYLGRVLLDDQGRESVISRSSQSHRAELLSTGVFIFNNVTPGTYGLVVDIGMTEFPVLDENQQPLLLEVQAGQAIDLGAVTVELP